MTEEIAIKLAGIVSEILPFNLYEAETGEYPYAVYSYVPEATWTKDGIYKYSATTYITVYSESFDEAQAKVDLIEAALSAGMPVGGTFSANLISIIPECVEGVWSIQMEYIINQYE